MKIVILGGDFNLSGGTERVATIIANKLAECGYEIVLASVQGGDSPFFSLHSDVQIRTIFDNKGRNIFRMPVLIYRLRRLLHVEKADAVVVVESMLALFTVPAMIGLSIKHICWEHFNYHNDLGRKGRKIARFMAAKYCDYVVTLTEKDRNYWQKETSGSAKIVSIPNPSPFPVLQVLPSSNYEKVVLSVGRLVNQKGYDFLLKAWAIVSQSAPEWKLRIVGDGPEMIMLNNLKNKLNIFDSVEFMGTTNDIEMQYRKATIFCMSSRFEGFPMVLLEALSFGLPIVSFDCETGPAEILDGTSSRLVKTYDVQELAENILFFIQNPEDRNSAQYSSLTKARSFQIDVIIERWRAIIQS